LRKLWKNKRKPLRRDVGMKRGDVFSTLPDIVSALGGSAVVVVKQIVRGI